MALYKVSCVAEDVNIENYADLVIYDSNNILAAIRFGGYPETVTAMADCINNSSSINVFADNKKLSLSTSQSQFTKSASHDGVYAECAIFRKDSELNADSSENEIRYMFIFCRTDSNDELFAELDNKLSIPLIHDFKDYLIDNLFIGKKLEKLNVISDSTEIFAYKLKVRVNEKDVAEIIEGGLKNKIISIPNAKFNTVFKNINGFSDYLQEFGTLIAEKIKSSFIPLFDPEKESVCKALADVNAYVKSKVGYELFNAQLAAAEGLKRELDKSKLALLISECGTGKSKIASAAIYAHQRQKSQPGFFNVVICPSHLCEKWVRELMETFPNCFAKVVDSISDLDKMYGIYKRGGKTVFCVLSKEKSRDGYMKMPAVVYNKRKKVFCCPICDRVQYMPVFLDGVKEYVEANQFHFRREHSGNHKCEYCGEVLWTALNPDRQSTYQNNWIKVSDYGFVYKPLIYQHLGNVAVKMTQKQFNELESIYKNPSALVTAKGAARRYPLSQYIKKKIKQIDALIVDELHQYSGDSGQGAAMADLAGVAKKVIGMTATLVNGYSKGIFYLLFRLKPLLMKLDDHEFDKSTTFCRQYGVVQKIRTEEVSTINSMSRGKKSKTREKFLPGISPLVYTRFLLNNAVFLSLADMGKDLPEYEEIPIPVRLDDDIKSEYDRIQNDFVNIIRSEKRIGQKILSKYLNLLSAYPDQPYGHPPVLNPFDPEEILVMPKDMGDIDTLYPKDLEVLDLVKEKVEKGMRVIIFTAWTRLDTQVKLQKLLLENGYQTKILDAGVQSRKREEWLQKEVRNGIDVLITNPALVETGLDLNDFTTLINYNIAFNLYVFRQSSRRSWRINQTAPRVEVYMLYYEDTLQQKALKLMASKLSAATVIEGNVSDEGLAAMADCNDMTTQLAKELVEGIKDSVDDLSASFKKMALLKPQKAEDDIIKPESEMVKILPAIPKPIAEIKPIPEKTIFIPSDQVQLTFMDLMAG